MQAEIISIGDEITRGQTLDTNSQWLSQQLESLGVKVLYHTTVADELQPNVAVFRLAIERADVVVATGGLGPTADDLTREALAQATDRPLAINAQALAQIRELFARRKRPMPAQNETQAYFPAGSRIIDNPHGTAPGVFQTVERPGRSPCLVFALPGVPVEMRQMWPSVVEQLKAAGAGRRVIRNRVLRCFGAGESQIESLLPDLIRRGRTPTVGITASQATISLRISAEGDSEAACEAQIEPTVATIRQCLGDLVYGEGDEQLQDVVVRLLAERGQTLATFEFGASALLADSLASAAGAAHSQVYLAGTTVYSADPLSPMSLQAAAKAMAEHCRREFGADIGLAIGPLPDCPPDDPQAPPVVVALISDDRVVVRQWPYILHPALVRIYFVKQALNLLRRTLLGLEPGPR